MMKKLKLELSALTVGVVAAAGLFATPAAPVASMLPTVGGAAHAYAPPCQDELEAYNLAYDDWLRYDDWPSFIRLGEATWDYMNCLNG